MAAPAMNASEGPVPDKHITLRTLLVEGGFQGARPIGRAPCSIFNPFYDLFPPLWSIQQTPYFLSSSP